MNTMKKTAAGTLLGGSLLVAGGLGLAHAAPPQAQPFVGDGKLNVTVTVDGQQLGVIQDVSLANAQALARAVCTGENASVVDQLTGLDTNQVQAVNACVAPAGATGELSYTFTQNVPANGQNGQGVSGNAPGHNRDTSTTPPSATAPTTPPGQSR